MIYNKLELVYLKKKTFLTIYFDKQQKKFVIFNIESVVELTESEPNVIEPSLEPPSRKSLDVSSRTRLDSTYLDATPPDSRRSSRSSQKVGMIDIENQTISQSQNVKVKKAKKIHKRRVRYRGRSGRAFKVCPHPYAYYGAGSQHQKY